MSYFTAVAGLSPASIRFSTYLTNSGKASSLACSIALARVIASTFPLPDKDVTENCSLHYRMSHSVEASVMFDAVNEICVHDRATVLKLVESFYVTRVNVAYMRPTTSGVPGSDTSFYSFFNLGTGFSKQELDFIRDTKEDMVYLCSSYAQIYEDLSRKN